MAVTVILLALILKWTKDGAGAVDLVIALLSGASIAVAVYFGVRGLQAWRAQLVGKRKCEVAEEALVVFERA